ncbi:MAG: DUF4173 domain-containing protein [Butyrivibrio sp.]|nr:DUF4173 domain-containing protein [Butyrivibrio sp.]
MEVNNNNMPQNNNIQPGMQAGPAAPTMQPGMYPGAATITPIKVGNAENFKKYGLLSIIYAAIYAFCLYDNHASITYPIFMAAALIIIKLMRAKDGLGLITDSKGKRGLGIFYVVSLMLLSIHRCMTTSWALEFMERTAIILLLLSFMVHLYVDTTGFDIGAWFIGIFELLFKPFAHLGRPFADHKAYKREVGKETNPEKKKMIGAILAGLGIALLLLLIVLPLLASADKIFESLLSNIKFEIDDAILDAIKMLLTGVFAFWYVYTAITSLRAKELKVKAKGEGTANPVIAITFTSIIGAVYVVFCAIQVIYLFSGNVALPKGYTYAEYAHEGFYQLLVVCVVNLLMVTICGAHFKESKVLKALLTMIAACTYIMIASSAMRMILYVQAYHLTFTRLIVLWFLVVLCFLLAYLIISLYAKKFPVFKACMVTFTIAFLMFIYSNPDYQVARYDLAVTKEGSKEYDAVVEYITKELSYDAVPAYADNKILKDRFKNGYNWMYNSMEEERLSGFRKYNFAFDYLKEEMRLHDE